MITKEQISEGAKFKTESDIFEVTYADRSNCTNHAIGRPRSQQSESIDAFVTFLNSNGAAVYTKSVRDITEDDIKEGSRFRLDRGEGSIFGVVEIAAYSCGSPMVVSNVNGTGRYCDTVSEFVKYLNENEAIDCTDIDYYKQFEEGQ
jgi:hypothetical protein